MTELIWAVLSATALAMAIATNRAVHRYQQVREIKLERLTMEESLPWQVAALLLALVGLVVMLVILLALLFAKASRWITLGLAVSTLCYALAWQIMTMLARKVEEKQ